MAYNPYYPFYSQYAPFPQTGAQNPQPLNNTQMASEPLKTQNNGFVCVRSVDEARNYPVAPGNSITFKVENSPFLCTKTMGFSQLDQPHFEKYRLVKEEEAEAPAPVEAVMEYAVKEDVTAIQEKIKDLEKRIAEIEKREDDGV